MWVRRQGVPCFPTRRSSDLWSYMPEAGRADGFQELEGRVVVPADSLSLRLRDFDFESKQPLKFWTVDSAKSNRPTNQAVNPAEARFVGEEDGAYKIQVFKSG